MIISRFIRLDASTRFFISQYQLVRLIHKHKSYTVSGGFGLGIHDEYPVKTHD